MDKPPEQGGIYASHDTGAFRIQTSRPECLYRHDISDEELTMLVNSSSDGFKDAMFASLGSAIGLAPTSLNYIYRFAWKGEVIDGLAVLNITVFAMSAAVLLCLFFVCKDKKNSAKTLSDAIRARSPQGLEIKKG